MPFSDIEKNLNYIKQKDARLGEAIKGLLDGLMSVASQSNTSPQQPPSAPPPVNGVSVAARNGQMTISVTDTNQVYRDIHYYAEHADNPQFQNPQIVHMGHSRNSLPIPIGNQTRYVRVYSSYGLGPPSAPVYHGSQAQPLPVAGGGADAGPSFLPSQGSGTGPTGVGLQGPGVQPFRSTTGKPPVR
jgi:hypothetical protein